MDRGASGLSVILALSVPVYAEPNALCPGTCPDATACGHPSDCGGDVCEFPDACLPGLSDLIEAVVPEIPNALNRHDTGWQCAYFSCIPSDDELAFSTAYSIYSVAIKEFVLPPGRTYVLRAQLGADMGAYGYIDVSAYDVFAASPFVFDSPDPVPVTLTVEVPDSHVGPLDLRLHANGSGYMHLSDVVIYELVEYGVWVRFGAPGATAPVRFEDDWILRHGIHAATDPHGYYPTACVGPVEPWCVDPDLLEAVALPGELSPWIEVSAMFDGGWRASHAWSVTDATSGAPLPAATVQIQMAWKPDPSAILWDDTRTLAGDTVGIVLPDGIPDALDLLSHRGYVADATLADHSLLLADPAWAPAAAPVHSWNGSVLGTIDRFDDPSTVEDTLDLFHDLGFNRRSFLAKSPGSALRERAEKLGMTKDLLHGEQILAPWNYTSTDLDLAALRSTADANLAAPDHAAVAGDFPSRPEDLFVAMGDEIGGLLLDGPLYRQGFHDYLAAEGLSASDFGVADLAELEPLPDMSWPRVPQLRPAPLGDPTRAKLFTWQLRWWNEATAAGYRVVREAVEQQPEWGAPYPMAFNAGTPFAPHYFTYRSGVESQTMARAGAVTALFAEGFLLFNDMCRAQQLGWFADLTSGMARPWGFPKHAYLHGDSGDQVAKVLTLASRGYSYFNTYMYGPYDLTTGDGEGGLGDLSEGWLHRVTAASDALAKAEPWLLGATRPPAGAAILAAQSDPIWTDLGPSTQNEAGWHLAWTHEHQAVDFLVEEHLASELEGRSVLLVDRKHLSNAAWTAVREWVEAGGTLVLGRGLAANDEYGQPVPARADWLGVITGRVRSESTSVDWGGRIEVDVPWAVLSGGATVATYANGESAVVEVAKGVGRVVVVGFDLGDEYLSPITVDCASVLPPEIEEFPVGWSDVVRAAAGSLVAGIPKEVDADSPLVEAVRVERPDGGAIVAVAYSNDPLTVTIAAPGLPDEVVEALTGASLPVEGGAVVLTLDHTALLGWTDSGMGGVSVPPATNDPSTEPRSPDAPAPAGCGCTGGTGSAGMWALLVSFLAASRRQVSSRSRGQIPHLLQTPLRRSG